MTERMGRNVTIDRPSIAWAYHLGRRMYLECRGQNRISAWKICPFSEGTPHRIHWMAGWKEAK